MEHFARYLCVFVSMPCMPHFSFASEDRVYFESVHPNPQFQTETHMLLQHTLHLLLCEQRQPLATAKESSPSIFPLNWAITRPSPAPLCSACSARHSPPLPLFQVDFKNTHTSDSHTVSRTGSSSHTHTLTVSKLSERLEWRNNNKRMTDSWYSSAPSAIERHIKKHSNWTLIQFQSYTLAGLVTSLKDLNNVFIYTPHTFSLGDCLLRSALCHGAE
ncbi:hypothetical protein AMELA_G00190710 [Ameiurus melas]|uniref:Uncharacterized protein n=1 Tax=Ameiurus melas TaxID=219545 RepID=A0A7J6ABU8_AMEME|nr:hypothetical protein AMELA_G00190710 [Ameiurus melas]